jgi:glycine betaine/proline transport system permease protein
MTIALGPSESKLPKRPRTPESSTSSAKRPRWLSGVVVLLAMVVAQVLLADRKIFPPSWNVGVAKPVNKLQSWVTRNRSTNPFIRNVLRPVGNIIMWAYETILSGLLALPWFLLPLAVFLIILRSGRWGMAVFASAGLLYTELSGLHEATMQTTALSFLCVLLCVAIGGPLGVWAGLHPRVDQVIRPITDVMQSLPTTIYLVPAVLFFGIRQVPAVIATVLFAVAPLIRIAALGIREVPSASVEAGTMFGSTGWQSLRKIRLPQAAPVLVTGVNQTIMAALSMAVIGAFVGAGGLGTEILQTLRLRSPGRGLLVGFAIVAIAISFDRLLRSLVLRPKWSGASGWKFWSALLGVLIFSYVASRIGGYKTVPWTFDRKVAKPIDEFVKTIRNNYGDQLQTVNDFVVRDIVIRLRNLLDGTLAWPVLIAGATALAYWLRGIRLALFSVLGLTLIGLMGMWSPSIETLSQLLVAVVLSILIAVPLGIFVGTRPRLESALNPFFELLQTLPSFIYAIPFVMIFAVGYLPGILSTVLYSVPAGVRLVAMAIKGVDPQTIEASKTFGATSRQRLLGVRIPMAFTGIMLGINQVVMMAMSMVIITGYIGSQGLGYGAVAALTKPDVGLGMEAGLSLVIMGILLDRMTEGFGNRFSPTRRQ